MDCIRINCKWIFTGILVLFTLGTVAQTLDDLRKKKQTTAEEIRNTNTLLGQVDETQKATLGKLRLINRQIEQRNQLISTMSVEVTLLQSLIDDNVQVIEMLASDLEKIKSEYLQLVQFAWKNRNAYDKILFFLSAENFNQAFRRLIYVRQFTEYRRKQSVIISSIQNILFKKTKDLENQQLSRKGLITEKVQESKKLTVQKKEQNLVSQQLQKQKSELNKKLAQQRRIEQQLEQAIQKIIEEETGKSVKSGKPGLGMTPEQKLEGSSFEQNRRRLPWPVEKGVITERFGIHAHPVLNHVTVNNNGVTITTEAGARARAVFNGEVSRVFGITGGNMAVILRHGQFLTVYSNLVDVTVKKGDKVTVKQSLGTIFTDQSEGNKGTLKFQIWEESKKLNPEEWLAQ
jgi:murein hydrolase activator